MPKALNNKVILKDLQQKYSSVGFVASTHFKWSPSEKSIYYSDINNIDSLFSLFHELAHGVLNHQDYQFDIELLQMEVAAWEKAIEIASQYNITIEHDHIDHALDSYRDWLHERATCPVCSVVGMEQKPQSYRCINCNHAWAVSNARFNRTYRMQN